MNHMCLVRSLLEVLPLNSTSISGSNNVVLWDTHVFKFTWNLLPFSNRAYFFRIENFSFSISGNDRPGRRNSDFAEARVNCEPLPILPDREFASIIEAGNGCSIGDINLLASYPRLPSATITPHIPDFTVSADCPDGAVAADGGPGYKTLELYPLAFDPLIINLPGSDTNIFALASSRYLFQFSSW